MDDSQKINDVLQDKLDEISEILIQKTKIEYGIEIGDRLRVEDRGVVYEGTITHFAAPWLIPFDKDGDIGTININFAIPVIKLDNKKIHPVLLFDKELNVKFDKI